MAQSAGPPDALTISSGSPATAPSNRVTDATLGAANKPQYTWRIDLMRTQQFWHEWFAGLSSLFLSIPEPKLLLLAGVDRLDKELTIGQMQGNILLSRVDYILPSSRCVCFLHSYSCFSHNDLNANNLFIFFLQHVTPSKPSSTLVPIYSTCRFRWLTVRD